MMKTDYIELAKNLFTLDKSSYPYNEIKKKLEFIKDFNFVMHNLHEDYNIIRIRRNYDGERFNSISELSYRPEGSNKTYCRASTPFNTMFYGSSCEKRDPFHNPSTDNEYALKVALFETLSELRNNYAFGFGPYNPSEERSLFTIRNNQRFENIEITYGIWRVIKDIQLVSICIDEIYDGNIFDKFERQRLLFRDNLIDNIINYEFLKYLSFEFSKKEKYINNQDFNYMVSAITSETLCELGYEGVSYPSSRNNGLGINLAIKPSIVDNNLTCTEVGLISVSSNNNKLDIRYLGKQKIINGQFDFDFKN